MADKSLLLPVGIPQNISIILSSCISNELFSGYQGNQICITRKNCIFLFMHTWAARATLENGSPEQCACSLKGTRFLPAVGCLPAQPETSPPTPACIVVFAALERPKGFGDHYTSQTAWEEVEGKHSWEKQTILKCLQWENKACKVCTKKSLVLTVFQPQFL